MIDRYPEKYFYLYKHQKFRCTICHEIMSINQNLDLHHKFHNTKWGRKKYPQFIDSLLNLELVHHNCHIQKGGLAGHIGEREAEKWERFLRRHDMIAAWVV